jgi:N6-adenosine-specific RNA methylase IME4
MTKYRTILADPPWPLKLMWSSLLVRRNMRPAELVYPTMTIEGIKALPVGELAEDGAHLWLWVTNQVLQEGLDVMRSWGFTYVTPITWKKPSGCGNYFIHHTQHILFGFRGKLKFNKARYIPNAYDWPLEGEPVDLWQEWGQPTKHSAKPAASYRLIESISDEPRLELFARPITPMFQKIEGWDVFGNEVESDIVLATSQPPLAMGQE